MKSSSPENGIIKQRNSEIILIYCSAIIDREVVVDISQRTFEFTKGNRETEKVREDVGVSLRVSE